MLVEFAVFESLTGGLVEDKKGLFLEKGRGVSVTGGGMG